MKQATTLNAVHWSTGLTHAAASCETVCYTFKLLKLLDTLVQDLSFDA